MTARDLEDLHLITKIDDDDTLSKFVSLGNKFTGWRASHTLHDDLRKAVAGATKIKNLEAKIERGAISESDADVINESLYDMGTKAGRAPLLVSAKNAMYAQSSEQRSRDSRFLHPLDANSFQGLQAPLTPAQVQWTLRENERKLQTTKRGGGKPTPTWIHENKNACTIEYRQSMLGRPLQELKAIAASFGIANTDMDKLSLVEAIVAANQRNLDRNTSPVEYASTLPIYHWVANEEPKDKAVREAAEQEAKKKKNKKSWFGSGQRGDLSLPYSPLRRSPLRRYPLYRSPDRRSPLRRSPERRSR